MQILCNFQIAFIGLGIMGMPMARNLKRAGAQVAVYNRSPQKVARLVKEGFAELKEPKDACRADVVICMLADTAAVEAVLFADNGVAAAARSGLTIIDMGTTAAEPTRTMAKKLSRRGVKFIDAPVSGGETGAIEGTLSIMVGAAEDDLRAVQPIFEILGSNITHVGGVGCGQIAKAANQMIVGLTIQAIAEAFALCQNAGADLQKVAKALGGGFADSTILKVHGQRMISGEFTPGGKVSTQLKDLKQALDLASDMNLALPATKLCRDRYQALIEKGDGHLDHSALFRLY